MAWALVCLAAASGAQPPTMHYNPPIVTIGGGFNQPTGIAVDDAGNLYVADTGNNAVEEIPIGCLSSSCVIAMSGGFNGPKGVVVDDRGNVFVADTGNNAVKEIPAGCTSSSCVILVGNGLNGPTGIAVDNQGYGYVADTGNNAVKGFQTGGSLSGTLGGGFIGPTGVAESEFVLYVADTGNNAVKQMQEICVSSDCVTALGGGFNGPTAVAVDFGNNVYVADTGNNVAAEMPPGCGSSSCVTMVGGGFNAPSGIAVDFRGNVFVADSGNNAVKEILRSVQLPTQPVRTKSSVATLTFTFDTGGSIGAPAVLTMGASGLDFADAGTGSCSTNGPSHPYNPGDTCTVDVTFTPRVPGLRKGAVELVDTSAAKNILATVFVYGVGTGPEAVFSPSTQTLLASGLSNQASNVGLIQGVAVDSAGNVYLSDPYNNAVKEIPSGCASSGCAITLGGGFSSPAGLAVDGAGNVYVADAGSVTVKEMPAGCASSSCVTTLGGGFVFNPSETGLSGVAVDGMGSVYVAGGGVWKMPAGCVSRSCVFGSNDGMFVGATGIAVDASGNVYVANLDFLSPGDHPAGFYGLTEMPGGCTSMYCVYSPVSGALSTDSIRAVALDGSGNIYVQGVGDGGVKEAPAGCASSSCVIALTGITWNLAVDDGGNLYLMDIYYEYQSPPYLPRLYQLIELNRATPPTLNFPTPTEFGTTDSADGPQTATVENIGNAELTFPLASTGGNPSVSANFTWDDAGSTCTQTDAGSGSAFMLAAGASCSIAIDFAPEEMGAINGSVILTDDSLYAPGYANQTIPLSGQGIQDTPLITWATPAAITYGTPLGASQLNATSTVGGTFTYSPAAGAVLGAGSQSLSVTFTPSDSTDYTTATDSVTLVVNKAAPVITWPTPAAITYGTALSTSQLDATASVAGSFVYSPAAGTIPAVGNDTLSAQFTPTDSADYSSATATVTLSVVNAVPLIGSLSPAFTSAGGSALTLTVNGSGFVAGSTVYWGTTALTTTYGSATKLTAQVPASDITSGGTTAVTVQTPAPGGGTSNPMQFEVDSGSGTPPTFTTITATVSPGSPATYPVTLSSSATNVTVTCLNLPAGASCTYSSTNNSVTITTTSTTPAGTYQITVVFTETLPGAATGFILLPILLLPLLFLRRKLAARGFLVTACLGMVLVAALAFNIGCGGGSTTSQTHQATSSGSVSLTVQ